MALNYASIQLSQYAVIIIDRTATQNNHFFTSCGRNYCQYSLHQVWTARLSKPEWRHRSDIPRIALSQTHAKWQSHRHGNASHGVPVYASPFSIYTATKLYKSMNHLPTVALNADCRVAGN